jgi:DNA gyrase inhibitor GyrI
VRNLPAVPLRYQRFFGQSGAALSIACNDFIRERERARRPARPARPWYGVFDEDPGFTGENEYCYDFGCADDRGAGPRLGLRVLPAGSYACLDFRRRVAALPLDVRGLAGQAGGLAPGQHRPHIQKVERGADGRWQGWLALPVKKR